MELLHKGEEGQNTERLGRSGADSKGGQGRQELTRSRATKVTPVTCIQIFNKQIEIISACRPLSLNDYHTN